MVSTLGLGESNRKTRQLNVLNSLFGAWEQYSSIMGDIDDRAGTTLENQDEYANSLKGHLGDIASTVDSIWNNVFETDDFKGILKMFNNLLEVVEKITDGFGTWGTLAATGIIALNRKLGLLNATLTIG